MEINNLQDLVGDVAVVTTILQFLSGVCALWLFYGVTKGDGKIILVNLVGIVLMTGYSFVFYMFTFKKSTVIRQFLITAVLFIFVLLFGSHEKDREVLLNFLGLLASIFTLVTISAPMSKLLYVIKVKNTECLPFPLILMSFLVSSLWTLYGYLIQDAFLEVVNIVGAGLAVAQLSLFLVYPSMPSTPILPKNMIDTF